MTYEDRDQIMADANALFSLMVPNNIDHHQVRVTTQLVDSPPYTDRYRLEYKLRIITSSASTDVEIGGHVHIASDMVVNYESLGYQRLMLDDLMTAVRDTVSVLISRYNQRVTMNDEDKERIKKLIKGSK